MVEKIDRPERRPTYEVREAKDAKEDQHYQHNPREEMEKKYREELEGKGKDWDKFGAKAAVIKPVVVPRENISKLLLRSVILFKGTGILQADVIWRDGRKTEGALVRLTRMEDYFQLKRLPVKHEVPENFWARSGQVELGIVQARSASGSFPIKPRSPNQAPKKEKKAFLRSIGLVFPEGKINYGMAFAYALIITLIAIAAIYEITR